MTKLTELSPGLWEAQGSLKLVGTHVGTRMVISRNRNDQLTLISPIQLNATLLESVKSLGSVNEIVIPNLFHHLYIKKWQQSFPEATLYGPPGLEKKRKDLCLDRQLWNVSHLCSKQLKVLPLQGVPRVNEVLFFHLPSNSLIVTDLLFHFCHSENPWDHFMKSLVAGFGRPGIGLIFRRSVKDKAAFVKSLEPIFQLPFTQIIMPHGKIITHAAKPALFTALHRYFPQLSSLESYLNRHPRG